MKMEIIDLVLSYDATDLLILTLMFQIKVTLIWNKESKSFHSEASGAAQAVEISWLCFRSTPAFILLI